MHSMRMGTLPEIFCNEDIIISGASGKEVETKWKLMELADTFPFMEVVKVTPINKNTLKIFVYDDTARALSEKRYKDVNEYSEKLEKHTFDDDISYIENCRKRKGVRYDLNLKENIILKFKG